MATLSSTLLLNDRFNSVLEKTIGVTMRVVDSMEAINSASDKIDMSDTFAGIRADISLAGHALDQLNNALEETARQEVGAKRLSSGFGGLSQAIIVANQGLQLVRSTWQGIQALGQRADARNGVDARLNLINDGLRTQAELETRVMRAANDSRASYETTAALIARIGRQDYFKGNNEAAVQFAETINKGMVVSGASVTEANGAIVQLTQGLASGVLRGEEFNSIMENAPVLAEMMTQSLGVTKGELRALAADNKLTTEVVVSSIMQQAGAIDEQFSSMPVTFGQASTAFENYVSQLMNSLSQPGQAVDILVSKMQELNTWAATADGAQFFSGMASGITFVIESVAALGMTVAEVYGFFMDNWTLISPILGGIAFFVGALTAAYAVYKGVMFATNIIQAIHNAGQAVNASTLIAATAAQWGLNVAMLASPTTWIIVGIIALIAVIVAVTLWIMELWKTNVDFKVGVIGVWNSILNWFDQVPIFFMGIGYGIADAFSNAKILTLNILESLVNGAIDKINWLIDKVNKIPGVSIKAIDGVTFGAENQLEEQAKQAERAAKLADAKSSAAAKAAERERQLAQDEAQWRAEAAAKEESAQKGDPQGDKDPRFGAAFDPPPVELDGGTIDKVGSIGGEVDISDQSIAYLHDIAEIQALDNVNYYATQSYLLEGGEARLSDTDADLLQTGAGQSTNIYYLNYNGGVNVQNSIQKGQSLDEIKQSLYEESESEIESGISFIEEALY